MGEGAKPSHASLYLEVLGSNETCSAAAEIKICSPVAVRETSVSAPFRAVRTLSKRRKGAPHQSSALVCSQRRSSHTPCPVSPRSPEVGHSRSKHVGCLSWSCAAWGHINLPSNALGWWVAPILFLEELGVFFAPIGWTEWQVSEGVEYAAGGSLWWAKHVRVRALFIWLPLFRLAG